MAYLVNSDGSKSRPFSYSYRNSTIRFTPERIYTYYETYTEDVRLQGEPGSNNDKIITVYYIKLYMSKRKPSLNTVIYKNSRRIILTLPNYFNEGINNLIKTYGISLKRVSYTARTATYSITGISDEVAKACQKRFKINITPK